MADIPKLTLYDFPADPGVDGWITFSPFVLEVERALRLAKLPFEHVRLPYQKVKGKNPIGQLPVLGIGSEIVADSTRILHRIEGLAPGSMTGGLDARGIAEAWLWEEFADAALYPQLLFARWADDRGWPVLKQAFFSGFPPVIRDVIGSIVRKNVVKRLVLADFLRAGPEACVERRARVLDALDARAPEGGFWLGPRATSADLGLFAHLHELRMPKTPWLAEEVSRRATLSRWLDRVHAATRG